MQSREIVIKRPLERMRRCDAATFVQLTCSFQSSLLLRSEQFQVNGKSLLGVLALQMKPGMTLIVTVKGTDEKQAIERVCEWFQETG